MDRCAIFVDAGHLLAQGGALCCGTGSRAEFTCDYPPLIDALARFVVAHCSLPLLRTYWYDGAHNYIPTLDHLTIAALPSVKLRLGRVIEERQKGVDALIYRDLMTLARQRAIATAFLLAGDEDLREGVVAAQDMGTRVILLGIRSNRGNNQSEFLVREVDEHVVFDRPFLSPYFSPLPGAAPVVPMAPHSARLRDSILLSAEEFAVNWVRSAAPEDLRRLLGQAPIIPADLDAQLIHHVQSKNATHLKQNRELRHEVRGHFWKALKETTQARKGEGPQGDA